MSDRKVDRRKMQLLERAFSAEISGALNKLPRMMQTSSALAYELVRDGLLYSVTETHGGVTIKGYELTHAGRLLYCSSCEYQ